MFTGFAVVLVLALLVADAWLLARRARYERETVRLRAAMTESERAKADAVVAAEQRRLAVMVELARQQARGDQDLHLAVAVDSGVMYLRRGAAVLREIEIEVGPARRVGIPPDTVHLAVPLGKSAVQRVLQGRDRWEVPGWIFADRGAAVPEQRELTGALGPVAVVLDGGTVIYSMPSEGPLADSSYIVPGAIRARAQDIRAVAASLRSGAAVYFY